MNLRFDKSISDSDSDYRALIIEADVVNTPTSAVQTEDMNRLVADLAGRYSIGDINRIPAIAATRAAYKACGKDPNRYRPSQEQMMRRMPAISYR